MKRALLFVSFLFVSAFLILAAVEMRPFGEPHAVAMDQQFIDRSPQETAVNNVVTAVVFDYRAFDTLGEATVLFAAVVAVLALFRKVKEDERYAS